MDRGLIERIVAFAGLGENDAIIEIGPGTGVLTQALLGTGLPMLCVELDRGLAGHLAEAYAETGVEIVHGDALDRKHGLNPRMLAFMAEQREKGRSPVFVSNLPYSISTPLFWNLFRSPLWERGIFMVQKEFAERLDGREGEKSYCALGVIASLYFRVEKLARVSPASFWPKPKVKSCLVRVERGGEGLPDADFMSFIKLLFSYRRKTIRTILARHDPGLFQCEHTEELRLPPTARCEEMSPPELLTLFRGLGTKKA